MTVELQTKSREQDLILVLGAKIKAFIKISRRLFKLRLVICR